MKDQRKKVDNEAETRELEQITEGASDDTQEMRRLSVQEIEELLKDAKPPK
jgi:hypothetical protein